MIPDWMCLKCGTIMHFNEHELQSPVMRQCTWCGTKRPDEVVTQELQKEKSQS